MGRLSSFGNRRRGIRAERGHLRHASHEPELLALDGLDIDVDFVLVLRDVHESDLAIYGQLVVGDHLGDLGRRGALGLGLEQVVDGSTTCHGLTILLGANPDLVSVRIDVHLLGTIDDVSESQDVGRERDDRDDEVDVRIVDRLHGEDGVVGEHGDHLRANMHQIASVKARFWIHPPLFQMRPAIVGATSSAMPQYQEWVGRQL